MGKSKNLNNKKSKREGSNAPLIVLICIAAVAVVLVFSLVFVLIAQRVVNAMSGDTEKQVVEFVPPEFDSGAIEGAPSFDDPQSVGYMKIYKEKMPYTAYVCGKVKISSEGRTDIYFTNPAENTLWMKLRIFDENGKIIGETGLIKPGEYIKTVQLDTIPKNGSKIVMRIMSYEPDTYYSGGEVSLNTTAIVK